ncbi:MAG: 4-(cytidine 5'-diphospho)-2-C-methyl-D-erythritol kinase [Glaciecola sp.]|nr:4-(cytidine 5'-diphospho)-2-C-methyl-D-erythritol kinase [Glaciecola sp.]MDG2100289.1 4-(cytidine 5'-diphospho)-2-C-methyl-D-erythritol kinase [Glaciecola sp.]
MSLLAQYQAYAWPSPAKLNMFLHITGRRADGYHELQSLFQMTDYGDSLQFAPNNTGTVRLLTVFPDVEHDSNLIVKAARLLKTHCNIAAGVDIRIEKVLPMGGGIGGGSTNAATVLVVLNQLWECGLSLDKLAHLGLALGADVPVFVQGKTTFAEGVGEHFTPAPAQHDGADAVFLVIHPGVHISTQQIFTDPQLCRNSPKLDFRDYTFAKTHNDCQELVVNLYPKVANLLQHLLHYAPSRLTGTGACVFAVFDKEASAQQVLQTLQDHQILDNTTHAFICKGVAESPLHTIIKSIFNVRD